MMTSRHSDANSASERTEISRMVAPGHDLRSVEHGVLSALPPDHESAPYDRHASAYDRLIGNGLYNRLIWGVRPKDYSAFAEEALSAGDGLFLDAGCGTAVFTSHAYRNASRPLVLVDRSLGMLSRASERLAGSPATLVQADLTALPFSPSSFDTVACFAVLHLFDDPWKALAALREQMAPGGKFFASMLVTDRGGISRPYLSALRRRGEVGPLRQADDLKQAAGEIFGESVDVQRTGSMAWLRAGGKAAV
jgi:SAM-dependent methyltransferase